MDEIIPFKCTSCGGTKFGTSPKPKSYDDLIGAVCSDCGHKITDEEIKGQAREIAAKILKDSLKRSRL